MTAISAPSSEYLWSVAAWDLRLLLLLLGLLLLLCAAFVVTLSRRDAFRACLGPRWASCTSAHSTVRHIPDSLHNDYDLSVAFSLFDKAVWLNEKLEPFRADTERLRRPCADSKLKSTFLATVLLTQTRLSSSRVREPVGRRGRGQKSRLVSSWCVSSASSAMNAACTFSTLLLVASKRLLGDQFEASTLKQQSGAATAAVSIAFIRAK